MGRAFGVALAFALACASVPSLADAPHDEVTTRAIVDRSRKLFAEGIALYKKGDFPGAYTAWLLAYQTRPHYTVAANLGDVELRLGKYRDAAEHLAYAVKHYPTDYPEEKLVAEANFARAKASIATVVIESNKNDAAILLDGAVLAHAPITDELYIEPGERRFQARFGEVASAVISATFPPGSKSRVQLTFVEPTAAPATTAGVPKETAPPPSSPAPAPAPAPSTVFERPNPARRYVLAVGGALTVVGAGVGAAYLLKRSSALADAAALRGDASSCFEPTPDCEIIDERQRTASDARKVATIAFVSAGAVAGMTLFTWALLPASRTLTLATGAAELGAGFTLKLRGVF